MFIEDFIEQAHQYEMLEERKSANMRDRAKTALNHSKMEMVRNNGQVINKILKVTRQTSRVIKKRKLLDTKTINNNNKTKIREEYFEQSLENKETMMNDYDLKPRI